MKEFQTIIDAAQVKIDLSDLQRTEAEKNAKSFLIPIMQIYIQFLKF